MPFLCGRKTMKTSMINPISQQSYSIIINEQFDHCKNLRQYKVLLACKIFSAHVEAGFFLHYSLWGEHFYAYILSYQLYGLRCNDIRYGNQRVGKAIGSRLYEIKTYAQTQTYEQASNIEYLKEKSSNNNDRDSRGNEYSKRIWEKRRASSATLTQERSK